MICGKNLHGILVQLRIHIPRTDGIDPHPPPRPLRRQRPCQLHDRRLGGVVGALLLRVQDARAGDGGDEDDGATAALGFGGMLEVGVGVGGGADHVAAAGLGDKEGAGEVDVEEAAELGGGVGFGFDVGARSPSVNVKIP